ncbi:MAG: hypothetical protein K0R38_2640 [Polyangiaceae bacterium]|jgi:hypothetical protein|nr:hypothetical protein [Polyangiaceae bacterium]
MSELSSAISNDRPQLLGLFASVAPRVMVWRRTPNSDRTEVSPASPCPSAPSEKLWFSRSYDGFEADTLCDDSDPGWF